MSAPISYASAPQMALRHAHRGLNFELRRAFDERFVEGEQMRGFGAERQHACVFERQAFARKVDGRGYLLGVLQAHAGQMQHCVQGFQRVLVGKPENAARQREVRFHHYRRTHEQTTAAEQGARRLEMRFGLARQESQYHIRVKRDQGVRPQASSALAGKAPQRMRRPLRCGASMPATSSTLRRPDAGLSTASPLRTSHCTGSVAEMCRAASIDSGTIRAAVCSAALIEWSPPVAQEPILGAC
jgi:hypothetical protein